MKRTEVGIADRGNETVSLATQSAKEAETVETEKPCVF